MRTDPHHASETADGVQGACAQGEHLEYKGLGWAGKLWKMTVALPDLSKPGCSFVEAWGDD